MEKLHYVDVDPRANSAVLGRIYSNGGRLVLVGYVVATGATILVKGDGKLDADRRVFIPEHRISEVGYR